MSALEWNVFADARDLIATAVASHATPAAVVEVGTRTGRLWTDAVGALTYDAQATPATVDTMFDLASLTKVIVTTTLVAGLRQAGRMTFDTPLAGLLPAWRGADRAGVTLRHLLDHSSGLPAHRRLWEQARGRHAFEQAIAAVPLESAPGERTVYSDLGFILLGFVVADLGGAPLDHLWNRWKMAALPRDARLSFGVDGPVPVAPTEMDPWRGHLLRGEVHDENAAALGGVAGHAGLFGSARAVGAFARLVLQTFHTPTPIGSPEVIHEIARQSRPEASRALGWDTMRPTSSCGTLMSPTAIGHTGFTGTSLWIDPEREVYVVLLSNRVHPTRENEAWPQLRSRLHDAVMRALPNGVG